MIDKLILLKDKNFYDNLLTMGKRFLSTAEVSKLLHINEKKVYTLAKKGVLPATKITGKWLFPEEDILSYLTLISFKNLKTGILNELLNIGVLVGAGSDDPVLTKIFGKFYIKKNLNIYYSTVGSRAGVELLKKRRVHFSLSHIYIKEDNNFNLSYIKDIFPNNEAVVINFFKRDIGIISKGKIYNLEELKDKNLLFVLRQEGSGVRIFTEELFNEGIMRKDWFKFSKDFAFSHFDVGEMVKKGKNTIGIASKITALVFGLEFFKLKREDFDLITLREYFFEKNFQEFFNFLKEEFFMREEINGYDFKDSGKIKLT